MAGEWIAVDLALDQKPEVQELIDETGEPVEAVCFRLWKLWGWASMHCADGVARMTIPRLVRTCGGDEAFWRAVAAVGWLEIDEESATVAVPGWDRRFSQAAKARLQHRDRAAAQEGDRGRLRSRAGTACAQAQGQPAPARRRGEERTGEIPPPPREASQPGEAWQRLRAAWNAGAAPEARRKPWKPAGPPDGAEAVIEAPGWLDEALEAIPRLAGCRYFESPVPLSQFVGAGFVAKVLGGQYDSPKASKTPRAGDQPADRPSAADAAAAWQRAASDPEAARRRQEFLDARKRKGGGDAATEAARAAALQALEAAG